MTSADRLTAPASEQPAHEISDVTSSETPASANDTLPPVELVSRFQDAYGVLIIGRAARRHVFFGLAAAQKVVDRAHARGDYAELLLVRLVPVGRAR